MYQAECDLPERGFWFRPTLFTNVSQSHRIAREEIFGPVLSILTFRTPAEAVEKANNTPYGLSAGIWTEKGSRILWMAERLEAGVVWANTFNRFDPASPFGGYKESGFGREGGRHGLEPYLELEAGTGPRRDEHPPPGQADREALHRRGVPAERVRPLVRGVCHDGRALGWAARASRKDLRDAVRAARSRAARVGRARPRTTAAQILYRVAELMEGRRGAVRVRARRRRRGGSVARRERLDRPLGLVRGMGRQDRAGPRRHEPRRGPVLQLHGPRAHAASSGSWRRTTRRCSGSCRGSRRRSSRGNTAVVLASETHPMPAVTLAEVLATSDVPGGVVNLLTGFTSELVPWLAGHMDVNAIDVTGVPEELTAQVEELAAENVKRVHRGPDGRPVLDDGTEPVRGHGVDGVQDRLAPDGRLREGIGTTRTREDAPVLRGCHHPAHGLRIVRRARAGRVCARGGRLGGSSRGVRGGARRAGRSDRAGRSRARAVVAAATPTARSSIGSGRIVQYKETDPVRRRDGSRSGSHVNICRCTATKRRRTGGSRGPSGLLGCRGARSVAGSSSPEAERADDPAEAIAAPAMPPWSSDRAAGNADLEVAALAELGLGGDPVGPCCRGAGPPRRGDGRSDRGRGQTCSRPSPRPAAASSRRASCGDAGRIEQWGEDRRAVRATAQRPSAPRVLPDLQRGDARGDRPSGGRRARAAGLDRVAPRRRTPFPMRRIRRSSSPRSACCRVGSRRPRRSWKVARRLPEATMPTADLDLARGEPALASARLLRRLNAVGREGMLGAPLLARLVEAQLAGGDLEAASASVADVSAAAEDSGHPMIAAYARLAEGRLAEARREPADAAFQRAADLFGKLELPLETARAQLAFAEAIRVERARGGAR